MNHFHRILLFISDKAQHTDTDTALLNFYPVALKSNFFYPVYRPNHNVKGLLARSKKIGWMKQ